MVLEHLPLQAEVGSSNQISATGVFPVIHFCGCRDFFLGRLAQLV